MVTDAKDVYDKGCSDTPSYGAQKSLAFTVAWLRGILRRELTKLRWTSTENMFVDAGTKDMDTDHLHSIMKSCEWCVTYRPDFVKQTNKKVTKLKAGDSTVVVGRPLDAQDEIFKADC